VTEGNGFGIPSGDPDGVWVSGQPNNGYDDQGIRP